MADVAGHGAEERAFQEQCFAGPEEGEDDGDEVEGPEVVVRDCPLGQRVKEVCDYVRRRFGDLILGCDRLCFSCGRSGGRRRMERSSTVGEEARSERWNEENDQDLPCSLIISLCRCRVGLLVRRFTSTARLK